MSEPSWRVAFLGTFHPGAPTLRRLAEREWIACVVLPQEGDWRNEEILSIVREFHLPYSFHVRDLGEHDINLLLAANYPKLVPDEWLNRVPCVNTHWSPLPRYRGVHGTAWGLLNGDDEFAVTVHWMEGEFDTGDIIDQRTVRLTDEMTIYDLHRELANVQAESILDLLSAHEDASTFPRAAQEDRQATYAPRRLPEDGVIDWSWPAWRIRNLVRALPAPLYPGAFTYRAARKLTVWEADVAPCPEYFCTVGQVVRIQKGRGAWVKAGDGCLCVHAVQEEGRPRELAENVLRRGEKLGVNPQAAVPELLRRIQELESRLERFERPSGD